MLYLPKADPPGSRISNMKMLVLSISWTECSQHFSHYKSMGIFSDAQGELTLQSMVGAGRISNSSETL